MSTIQPESKFKLIATTALAYLSWISSFLLWLWFILIGRSALLEVLGLYFIQGKLSRRYTAQLADRIFVIVAGIIWVVLMVVVEEYFRRGINKGDLLRRIGRVFAPIVFLVFTADITMAFLIGFENVHWLRGLLLIAELVGGAGFVWLARNGPGPKNTRSSNRESIKF